MPLSRPALTLGPGPRGVQQARHWVVDVCHDIERSDLAECAGLGVTELVTNALLHARGPVQVRVRGTRDHPRVEVRDASSDPPTLPQPMAESDAELLSTFGRGLAIVARCAQAWGAEVEGDGKVVWFVPAQETGDDPATGVISGLSDATVARTPGSGDVWIDVLGVPPASHLRFQHHYRELRREVRLLAFAHEEDYPLAKNLSDLFGTLEPELRGGMGADQIEEALRAGRESQDLRLCVPADAATSFGRLLELLDLADSFCRQERLLSLARSDDQRSFQRWFLGEFVRQCGGQPPLPWHDPSVTSRRNPAC